MINSSGNGVVGSASDIKKVYGKAPTKPSQIDGVFSESVAKCGRIFSQVHSYFMVKPEDKEYLSKCVTNIKSKYYGR